MSKILMQPTCRNPLRAIVTKLKTHTQLHVHKRGALTLVISHAVTSSLAATRSNECTVLSTARDNAASPQPKSATTFLHDLHSKTKKNKHQPGLIWQKYAASVPRMCQLITILNTNVCFQQNFNVSNKFFFRFEYDIHCGKQT